MLGSLIAFANTGSPDIRQLKWPAWNARNEQYVVLGDEITITKLQTARIDWLATHPPATLADAPPAHTGPQDSLRAATPGGWNADIC
jgi:hypothetical protein